MKPKIVFVVQRYGTEVVGGAETHCRDYAESLLEFYEVEVLTSCALDYNTWAHHYPAGVSKVQGVTVRRFPAVAQRNPDHNRWWTTWQQRPRTLYDEMQWLFEQGPVLPGLLSHLAAKLDEYHVCVFFTYLYYPTVLGLRFAADKSVFVPFANPGDDPLSFKIFRELFNLPKAIIYCSDEERDHCHRLLGNAHVYHEVIGMGFEAIDSEAPRCFRGLHSINGPYALFLGRIGPSKGCDILVKDFLHGLSDTAEINLVLAGTLEMELPCHPRIHHVGVIDGAIKRDALCGATAIITPSPWDSQSLMTCEAWAAGRPVLVTAKSPVVSSLCTRSGGGAIYHDANELANFLQRLMAEPQWGIELGRRGREFLLRNYGKATVTERLVSLIEGVYNRNLE